MRRKFLSVVLCVCMMLTMAPFAFATEASSGSGSGGGIVTQAVAQIDNTTYNTLSDAITAAENGKTITLLSNTSGQVVIPTDKDITLDLNGNTITHTGTTVYNLGKLTIRDSSNDKSGKIISTGNVGVGVGHNSTTTIEYANIEAVEGAVITGYATGATITINDGNFRASDNAVIAGNGNKTDDNATGKPVRVNPNKINILGGTFIGNIKTTGYIACGIYAPWKDIITVSGGDFTVNNGIGIVARAGQVTVTGGSFTCNGTAKGKVGDKNFDMDAAQSVYFDNSNPAYPAFNSETDYIKLIGGTFSSDVSAYVADGYIQTESGTVEALNANNAVAKINDTYYKTLASAVAAAESDATVTLLKNTKEKVTVSHNLTVDLGGHTLTGSDLTNGNGKPERVAFTANAGNVTIQNGIIDGRVNAYDASNLTVAADLTIKNGYNGEGYDCFGIVVWGDAEHSKTPKLTLNGKVTLENGGIALSTNGTDMSNAEITINNSAIVSSNKDAAIYLPSGKLIMNGGTISGPTGIQICAGNANITSEFQLNGGTVTATGTDMRTSKGTGDGLIPDGAAISIVNRNYPNGVPSVTINSGSFSSVNNDAILAYTWSNGAASTWEDAASRLSITGGYFTSDPTTYVKSTNDNPCYVVESDTPGYSYMVTKTAPTKAPVIVADQTQAEANLPSGTSDSVKNSITTVIDNASIDGVAEAVNKDSILTAASVPDQDKADKNAKIVIDVQVNVKATGATTTTTTDGSESISTLTFTASPQATVKNVTGSGNTTYYGNSETTPISVPNSYLNGKEITVKLPLPEGFTPKQIKHISTDNSVEYFLNHSERGAKMFTVDNNHCAVFTITKFSTFEVSGTQTYVEPSSGGSISAPTTYAVNVNAATNGAVAADKKTASKGTTVTVTASPSKGYVVDAVKVVDKDGKDVAVTGKDGKYVFTMPGSAVTVTGTFKAETPAPVALPFTDVKSGNWFYDAVKYAYAQGLMTGTSATTFAPNGTMNRAMIVTVLYRLEKSPAVTGASKFTDVPAGQWYSDAVAWAAANKIVNGYDETTFGPMNAVTREQMAAILFRYEQVKGLENVTLEENLNRFPDQNKISAYAIPALQWAVGQKIINGNADGTLDPTGTATRAQVAQIFTNLLNK